jgi:hypothetical protein
MGAKIEELGGTFEEGVRESGRWMLGCLERVGDGEGWGSLMGYFGSVTQPEAPKMQVLLC